MIRRSSFAALLLLGQCLLLAPATQAAPPRGSSKNAAAAKTLPSDVESAEQAYQKLDYEQANAIAQEVLKRKGLSRDELVRSYRVLAVTHAVLDHGEEAKQAFIALLAVDPDYEVDKNLGPRVSEPFGEARGYWRNQGVKPGLVVEPTVRLDGGGVRVVAKGPPQLIKRVVVGYRWGRDGSLQTQTIEGTEGVADVKKAPAGATRLDYYVQAQDENQSVILERGTPGAPISLFPEAAPTDKGGGAGSTEEGGSVFGSPIFWIVTGVLVAGGAATAYYFLGPAKIDAPTEASFRPVLTCGTTACL